MDTKEKANEYINTIKEQIDKFDNKANILIAIVGIVFAISLGMLDIFPQILMQNNKIKYILLIVFTILYFISFALEMLFLLMVIYPRRKKNKDKKSLSYYQDVSTMTEEELNDCFTSNNSSSELDQLKINAIICARKHKFLVIAIWTLIPLFIFIFAMFFTAIL